MTLPDLSAVATLIGDPARAALLTQLFDGAARTAGELARGAGISPQSASNQLARLRVGGLIMLEVQGRHHYYRLAGREVAQALEALSALTGPGVALTRPAARFPPELRFARTCYDHLAGELGVALTAALVQRGALTELEHDFRLTTTGEGWFQQLGLDVADLRLTRRVFARRCLDWSERRVHLGGLLGAALLGQLRARRWVVRVGETRALRLTLDGASSLERECGLRGLQVSEPLA